MNVSDYTKKAVNTTWRMSVITVKAQSEYEMQFDDTTPTIAGIQNYGNAAVHMGINIFPSANKYEFKVDAGLFRTVGKPTGFSSLFFYNTSTSDANLLVYSVTDEFNIEILKDSSFTFSGSISAFDGIIKGFTASLPSGDNNIGNVDIVTLPALPTGSNTIGKVDVNTLPALPTGNNVIGTVKRKSYVEYRSDEGTIAAATPIEVNFTYDTINYISNDGANPMTIELKNSWNAYGTIITLKSGETFSNFDFRGNGYRLNSTLGTTYRMLLGGAL